MVVVLAHAAVGGLDRRRQEVQKSRSPGLVPSNYAEHPGIKGVCELMVPQKSTDRTRRGAF